MPKRTVHQREGTGGGREEQNRRGIRRKEFCPTGPLILVAFRTNFKGPSQEHLLSLTAKSWRISDEWRGTQIWEATAGGKRKRGENA